MGAHTKFEEVFNLLKEYKEEHGHCNVPSDYKVGTINLGDIVGNIRGGKRNTTSDQKAMLDSIGFIWNVKKCTSFEEFFRLLEEYKEEHGHCNVPSDYKVGTINLGDIVSNIRGGKRKTTNDQKQCLTLSTLYGRFATIIVIHLLMKSSISLRNTKNKMDIATFPNNAKLALLI